MSFIEIKVIIVEESHEVRMASIWNKTGFLVPQQRTK